MFCQLMTTFAFHYIINCVLSPSRVLTRRCYESHDLKQVLPLKIITLFIHLLMVSIFIFNPRRHALSKTSPRDNHTPIPDTRGSHHLSHVSRSRGLDIESKSYLSLSPHTERDSSSRCRCNSKPSRKGSVLSFSEVDTHEVHRMMKYINHSKVCTLHQENSI